MEANCLRQLATIQSGFKLLVHQEMKEMKVTFSSFSAFFSLELFIVKSRGADCQESRAVDTERRSPPPPPAGPES